jgi:scyllo-inositol 2-dehydrogenase (NADP+)
MSNKQGVLLVGYGLAGRVFHAPLIRSTQGLSLRAVVTSDPQRRGQAAADLPGVRIHSTSEEAWRSLDDVDLVVIASANRTHVPLAIEAARRGLHMVIDKPIAATAAQAQLIVDAAATAGVQVHPFQNRRWDSDFLTLRAISEQGILGRIHRFESRIERLRTLPKGNWRESADPDDLGGVLLDFGAHLVDQALALMGPVTAVNGFERSVRDPHAANDDMQIVLTHADGALSILTASQQAAFGDPRFILLGTTGGVRIAESDSQESALKAGTLPSDPAWGVEPAGVVAQLRIGDTSGELIDSEIELVAGRWNDFYPAVLASILSGSPAPVASSDVLADLRVLDAAMQSAGTGETVHLSPPAAHG